VLCVRWYLRYSLSYRDLEEMIAERGLGVDHSTIARCGCGTLRFSTNESGVISGIQIGPGGSMKHMSAFLANGPIYIELDSEGNSIDFMLSPYRDRIAAKHFLQLALSRVGYLRPRVINVDGHPPYPSVITELKQTGELSNACVDVDPHSI
jgi:IS6 family transposase